MKTIAAYGLTTMLLVALTTWAFAQSNNPMRSLAAQQMQREQQMQRDAMKRVMNSFWSGEGSNLMAIGLLHQDDFREGIGLSEEQGKKMQDAISNMGTTMQNDPNIKPLQEEMTKFVTEQGNPFAEDVSEETREKFFEIQGRIQAKMQEVMMDTMTNMVNDNLTPNQMKKVKEFQISTMSETPVISPNMFEALDLSDDQKKQLDGIKKDMEPEFEKFVDKMIDGQMKFQEKLQDALDGKLEGVTDPEERTRIHKETLEKVLRENPEFQRANNELMESGRALADRLKIEMFDVLDDAQWERMLDLIDNPPEYVKKAIARIRKEMGTEDSSSGGWQPGPGSWQPGDAIPEAYRQERNTRGNFPRLAN